MKEKQALEVAKEIELIESSIVNNTEETDESNDHVTPIQEEPHDIQLEQQLSIKVSTDFKTLKSADVGQVLRL